MCHANLCQTKRNMAEAVVHGCPASAQVIWVYAHAYGDGQISNFLWFFVPTTFFEARMKFSSFEDRGFFCYFFSASIFQKVHKSFC